MLLENENLLINRKEQVESESFSLLLADIAQSILIISIIFVSHVDNDNYFSTNTPSLKQSLKMISSLFNIRASNSTYNSTITEMLVSYNITNTTNHTLYSYLFNINIFIKERLI